VYDPCQGTSYPVCWLVLHDGWQKTAKHRRQQQLLIHTMSIPLTMSLVLAFLSCCCRSPGGAQAAAGAPPDVWDQLEWVCEEAERAGGSS